MEESLYGSGAGVQLELFPAETPASFWLDIPYRPVDLRPLIESWVLSRSSVRGQRVSTGPYDTSLNRGE